ncbi:MAG: RnfABCDGE type electron transport complex subunit B [Tissierellia bacterium]|nr:RnfABCDGE type electron transport complex subunit B [Tissierellia bacterium]
MTSVFIPVVVLGGLGFAFALLLSYASKVFHVAVDRKVEEVRAALPGANCGACGFPGCDGLAKAIALDGASISSCPIGGQALVEKLAEIMGQDAVETTKEVAVVMCQGDDDKAGIKYNYQGIADCRSMAALQGGNKICNYGCLGGATCQSVCDFDAIRMENGLAVIDRDKCTACMRCIDICPQRIIDLVPYDMISVVKCKSYASGRDVRGACKVGCIGCKQCVRQYPEGFVVEDFLAKAVYDIKDIDQEKLDNAIAKCPPKCIYPGLQLKEEADRKKAAEKAAKEKEKAAEEKKEEEIKAS